MADVKVRLDAAMGTSLIMLYGLAKDARSARPILGDAVAAAAYDKVDYDWPRLKLPGTIGIGVCSRAKHFDDRAAEFVAGHERAVVLNLGAGLDSRVWRIDPGPGVTWYDVDLPGVVEVRRKIFPERENYRLVAASVTDPEWLESIPADLPVLVIAQGLTMYLRPEDGHALFRRITDRFASGEILLDTHNSWVLPRQDRLVHKTFGAHLYWAIDTPADLERVNPALHCADSVSGLKVVAETPQLSAGWRLFSKLGLLFPKVRDSGLFVRYTFGA